MTHTRKQFILILFGVVVLTVAIIVWILNQDLSSDLLAIVGVVGGLAIVINSLPERKE